MFMIVVLKHFDILCLKKCFSSLNTVKLYWSHCKWILQLPWRKTHSTIPPTVLLDRFFKYTVEHAT